MYRVAIVYRHIPQYRVEFYNLLRVHLAERGIILDVYYGQPIGEDALKGDSANLRWGHYVKSFVVRIGRKNICYQPVLFKTSHYDLLILEQASRLLFNYLALIRHMLLGRPKVALWGHGWNRQADGSVLSNVAEWVKSWWTCRAVWFFAYTTSALSRVLQRGFRGGTTVLNNTIDTTKLERELHQVTKIQMDELRTMHRLKEVDNVCLFIGALYEEKRIDFLLESADVVARELPDFRLVVVGSGPLRLWLEQQAATRPWLRVVGPAFSEDKAAWLRIADCLLIPGLVGLVIIDSFVAGVPLVTTAYEKHSPEIDYLTSGENGLMSGDSVVDYSNAILNLLRDGAALRTLRFGAGRSAQLHSIESMVSSFASGVAQALEVHVEA